MNLRDRILLNTPPALQSLVTTAGSRLRFGQRFGSVFRESMVELKANECLDRKGLLEAQAMLLQKTLHEARGHVPFYRESGLAEDDLLAWPVIDKATIRRDPAAFLSDRYPRRSLLRSETSGTSGSPLRVFSSAHAYQWEMAFRWRHRAWAGIPFGAKGAYLSGHLVIPQTRKDPPFWVHDGAEHRILFSSYHLNDRNLPSYVSALVNFAPEFVHGYPSSLYLVAKAIQRSARRPRPKAVFAASETLLPYQRIAIEEAFGCKVFAWYGQTELTLNIVECERGSLHLRDDYGIMETALDGAVLGTGLRNPAMPMIRYRTGDVIERTDGECDCGRAFSLVRAIEGRVEDYVVTPSGTRVGRLDHLFKGASGVVEAQIIQNSPSTLCLRIVRGEKYTAETERAIRRESLARIGPEVALAFEYVHAIPRGVGGKFRFVVSTISDTFPRANLVSGSDHEAGNDSCAGDTNEADNSCDKSR